MDVLDGIELWLRSLQSIFESGGIEVHFNRTADPEPKASAVFNLRRNVAEADLLVWQTGEAELSVIENDGTVVQEHFDNLSEPRDLAAVLSRVATLMGITIV